jgi:glutathione S-transferase
MRDGQVTTVESVAIMEYLIARYRPAKRCTGHNQSSLPPLPTIPPPRRQAGLATCLNIVVASRYFAPDTERDHWGVRQAVQMFLNRLTLLSRRLGEMPYLAGETFTAADVSVSYALELGSGLGASEQYGAAVKSYLDRLREREAFQSASRNSAPWSRS